MANEITIIVKGDNRSKPALKEPGDDADKLKAKISGTDQVLLKLMADFNRTGDEASKFGRTLTEDGQFGAFLEERLASLHNEAHSLGAEFERTGNIDVFKKLKDNQASSDAMTKIKKDLERALDDGANDAKKGIEKSLSDAGQNGGQSLFKQVTGAFEGGGVSFGTVMAGVLIAGAPLIGAALNAALIGGVGLGGLAIGIVGQLHDPAVHAALVGVGNNLLESLHVDTAPFKTPLLAAIGTVGDALQRELDSINFKKLSEALGPLANGIAGLFDKMGPGLNEGLDAAVPVLTEIGAELPGIGEAIGNFFHELAGSSTGAVEGIRTLLAALGGIIEVAGHLIGALSNAYEAIIRFGDSASDMTRKAFDGVPVLGSLANAAHRLFNDIRFGNGDITQLGRSLTAAGGDATLTQADLDALAGKIGQVTTTADTLAASMTSRLFTATMNVDQATLGWHSSLTRLSDTLNQNGLAIDKHTHLIALDTKHGEENRSAILAAVQANMAQYQANVAVGMSAQDAAAAYDQNTEALRRQLEKAHYTSAQIEDLIGKYKNIPDTVNTNIAMQGLTDAINGLADLIAKINGIERNVVVDIWANDHTQGTLGGRNNPLGFHEGHGRATGGIDSGMTWVGEHGAELVNLPPGSQVYSHGDSQRMAATAMASTSSGDTGGRTINFVGDTDRAFARLFAQLVRDRLIVIS